MKIFYSRLRLGLTSVGYLLGFHVVYGTGRDVSGVVVEEGKRAGRVRRVLLSSAGEPNRGRCLVAGGSN